MMPRPMWCFECLDREEALALLEQAPAGSHVEVIQKAAGELVLLWVPVAPDLLAATLEGQML